MKTVCKKLLCLMLVAMLLVSAVPAAFATETTMVNFYIELYVDEAPVDSKPVSVPVGTNMDEGAIKLYAKEHLYGTYFGEGYEYDRVEGTKEATQENLGAKIFFNTVQAGCQHEDTVNGKIDATCTTDGSSIVRCSDCGEIISRTVLPMLGHDFEDGACTRCGEEDPDYEAPANKVVVTIFESVDGEAAKQIGEKEVDVDAYASEEAMVKALYKKPYKSYRYRDFGDGTAQLVIYALETEDGDDVFQLKVMHNDSTSNYTVIDIYEDEGILAAISNAGIVKKLKDQGKEVDDVEYRLVGFSINHTGNAKTSLTIHHKAEESLVGSDGYIKVYADWEKKTDDDDDEYEIPDGVGGLYGDDNDDPIYDVVLYIYTNGKTSSYAKKVSASSMGKYTKDGKLTTGEVELVVNKYFKTYDDTKYYGLFTKYYWNDGNYLTKNAVSSIDLDPDETNYVYVMVKDAKAYVADSSNPKTGDSIMIAVTTMALAAAGVVSMIELKKRKMI